MIDLCEFEITPESLFNSLTIEWQFSNNEYQQNQKMIALPETLKDLFINMNAVVYCVITSDRRILLGQRQLKQTCAESKLPHTSCFIRRKVSHDPTQEPTNEDKLDCEFSADFKKELNSIMGINFNTEEITAFKAMVTNKLKSIIATKIRENNF